MPKTMLEPEFAEPYGAWKKTPSPATNAAMLTLLRPHIDKAVSMHLGQGSANPLLTSRARRMALDALPRYDPSRAKLSTFVTNELQGLKRVRRQQSQVVKAPERILLDRAALQEREQELRDSLGREPSDMELADWSGFSLARIAKVRQFQPAVATGTLENAGVSPGMQETPLSDTWVQLVYGDLSATDQRILEHTLGLHGRRRLSNQEIAAKLRLSPGAISQRKKKIQELLDKERELSPLL